MVRSGYHFGAWENDIILDIRSPEETDENPFESDEHQVMQLPFYKLSSHSAH